MLRDRLGLEGKAALVVGAGQGIARSIAVMLTEAGARVAVADVDRMRAEALAKEIGGHAIVGDVCTEEGARAIVNEAHDVLGGLSRLANVVGDAVMQDFVDNDSAVWESEFRLNITQQMYVCQEAGRHMLNEGGGAMALVSSSCAFFAARTHVAYGVAKAGLNALARGLADEWGRHGIRVNTVAPHANATPIVMQRSGLSPQDAQRALDERAREAGIPLGRFGRPDEVGGTLLFLLSDLSSFITGQCILVDGGATIHLPVKLAGERRREAEE